METKTKKTFDTVKMMRGIRNKISIETKDMSFEQLKNYVTAKIKNSELKNIGKPKSK